MEKGIIDSLDMNKQKIFLRVINNINEWCRCDLLALRLRRNTGVNLTRKLTLMRDDGGIVIYTVAIFVHLGKTESASGAPLRAARWTPLSATK